MAKKYRGTGGIPGSSGGTFEVYYKHQLLRQYLLENQFFYCLVLLLIEIFRLLLLFFFIFCIALIITIIVLAINNVWLNFITIK